MAIYANSISTNHTAGDPPTIWPPDSYVKLPNVSSSSVSIAMPMEVSPVGLPKLHVYVSLDTEFAVQLPDEEIFKSPRIATCRLPVESHSAMSRCTTLRSLWDAMFM